jgi:DNA-binding NtrC family response regulator
VTEPDERGQPSVFERHPWLLDMRLLIQSIADTGSSVLIRGESSRMCEIVAEAIHASCPRGGVFVRIYCGAVSPDLCEAELFGVEEKSGRKGGLVEFRESTLYIHDIAKMPPVPQAKLLRTLQDHRVLRQGGRVPIDVDIRVVAATNGDLEAAVSRGEFLEELYRLLKTAEISAPPGVSCLREDKPRRGVSLPALRTSVTRRLRVRRLRWPGLEIVLRMPVLWTIVRSRAVASNLDELDATAMIVDPRRMKRRRVIEQDV